MKTPNSHRPQNETKAPSSFHNILELVLGRPSGYSAKHYSKSLLKRDFIPFLSNYAHSSTATCMFLSL
jgi:hypothetical protein